MAPKKAKSASLTAGTVCLAKLKGFPGWPSQIMDNDALPPNVRRAAAPKGSFCVQFFPVGDYAWLPVKDITVLSTKDIDNYLSGKRKNGELTRGYEIAKDPQTWSDNRAAHSAAYAENPQDFDEPDELDDDEDTTAGSKKRKRASNPTPKLRQSAADKKKASETKSKKKAAAQYSDDEPAPKKSKPSTSAAADPEGLQSVKDWRHKLQKVFLGKSPISADEMPKCKEYFDAMEVFPMNQEWLAESKLGKVLKRIGLLTESAIPLESEYKFRDRAAAIAAQWTRNLGGDETPVAANGASTSAAEDVEMAAPAPVEEEVVAAPVEVAPAPVVEEEKVVEAEPVVAAEEPAPAVEEPKVEVEPVVENGANGVPAEVVEEQKVEELVAAVEPVL